MLYFLEVLWINNYFIYQVAGGSYFQRRVFFMVRIYFRMYLPLVLEVNNRLFSDCLGLTLADKI